MQVLRSMSVVAFAFAIAIVVIGGLPGRSVERDEAKCYVNELLVGPHAVQSVADATNILRIMAMLAGEEVPPPEIGRCVPDYVVHERPASGLELRVLAGFVAACALLAALGGTQLAATLLITLGLAGLVVTFVVTRAFDSPFDETVRMWPYYAVRALTAGLALTVSAWLVMYVRREMKV